MKIGGMDRAEIKQRIIQNIRNFEPDALVIGLGPTIEVIKELDLSDYRTFGVNDIDRHMRVLDLVIIDRPNKRIAVNQPGYWAIANTTADRIWIRKQAYVQWKPVFSDDHLKRVREFVKYTQGNELFDRWRGEVAYTTCSPTAAVVIAWAERCRRIGLLGVDHVGADPVASDRNNAKVSRFLSQVASQAKERGGAIANLSPISQISLTADFEKPQAVRRRRA